MALFLIMSINLMTIPPYLTFYFSLYSLVFLLFQEFGSTARINAYDFGALKT